MSAVPATPSSGQQNLALWGSTFAFTVCFAVWTIFSPSSASRSAKDLGLSDTQFGLLVATPVS
jgi:NNP family nitrate/nitrite transporter-like MFS transporter